MNEISSVAMNVTPNGVSNLSKTTNVVNFRANRSEDEQVDAFIKEQEKAKKKAERDKKISMGLSIGTFAAFLAIAVVTIASMTGKLNPAGFKKSNIEFKKYINDNTLGELKTTKTLQEDVRTMLMDMVNSKQIKPEYLELAGGTKQASPNAAILLGKSGVGKTESIKMKSKEDGSELAIVKMSSFGNSYLNGNAISMAEMFKSFEKIFEKNPDKKDNILFD